MRSALRLLRSRDRTEAEVRAHLASRGFTEEESGLVLASLKRSRFVDDARVADRAVEAAQGKRVKGRLLVEHELKVRGVEESAVEDALGAIPSGSEADRAESALRKRLKPGDTRQKSAGFLVRRGFDEDTVQEAIERVFGPWE
ncbi:MAG TPA: regulatory protein RecX [Fimbriimonadaceae bacterium]|nr:regulatory protein RecX [Fimbriimonadaceae bacterium]